MEDIVKYAPNRFLYPTNEFIKLLHKTSKFTLPTYKLLLQELNISRNQNNTVQSGTNHSTNSATTSTTTSTASNSTASNLSNVSQTRENTISNGVNHPSDPLEGQIFLRSLVISQMERYIVRKGARSALKVDTFPGPMASQLTRNKIDLVRNNDYYITEKSDGLRCMMATFFREDFPRWSVNYTQKDKTTNKVVQKKHTFAIKENLFIEIQILSGSFNNPFMFKWIDGEVRKVQLERLESASKVSFRIRLMDCEGTPEFTLTRLKGWQFSYVFDRKFLFHLCTEEFVFLVKGNQCFQNMVILDGEIVWNYLQKRYNYSIYDIVTVTVDEHTAVTEFGIPPEEARRRAVHVVPCGQLSVTDKIRIIKEHVFQPHYSYYNIVSQPPPSSLQLIVKHFYTKKEIETILSCVKKDEKTGQYIYKQYNNNDGFVFTPASSRLYTFEPGTARNLVKWKWPDKLTADFLGIVKGRDNQNRVTLFDLHYQYFESSQRKNPNYNGHAVYFKTLDLRKQWDTMEESVKEAINSKNRCIVECYFDDRFGDWEIHMVRKDKVKANSYQTIVSTLTNVMEDITSDDLINICKYDGDGRTIDHHGDNTIEQTLIQKNIFITLRLEATNGVYFQAGHSIEDSTSLSYNRMLSTNDVIGPSGERDNALDNLCYEIYDLRSSSVFTRLIFMPATGFWKIIDFEGESKDSSAVTVLHTLEKMSTTILQTNRSLNFGGKRKREDPSEFDKRRRIEY